jgi:putative flippase GtrA
MSLRALVAVPFVRFLGVGVFNTALGYALFAAFVLIGAPTLMAVMASTALGALFNFGSIGVIVFASKDMTLLPRFLAVYVGQCAINALLLIGLAMLRLEPLLAQLLLLPLLASGTYLAMRHCVFPDRAQSPGPDHSAG